MTRHSLMALIVSLLVLSCKTAPSTQPYFDSIRKKEKALEPAVAADSDDPCPEEKLDCHPRRFLVADDGLQKIAYVNLDDPSKDWDIPVGASIWDMQLGGGGKVLVPTTDGLGGYYEIDIEQGRIAQAYTSFGFVRSVQRLKNGNTLIAGENLKGNEGLVIIEVDPSQTVLDVKTKKFPKAKNSRVIRRTFDNTFLMGSTIDNQSDHVLLEMDEHGFEVQRFLVGTGPAHMGVRMQNGDTAVTSGRDRKLLILGKDGKLKETITLENQEGKTPIDPFQAGFFQILANGHYVLANWQGKNITSGRKGHQLVEYNAKGKQVWAWKQDPKRFSSISAVLVLDGLDLSLAHDDTEGPLKPVQ
ncbi:MAG: hypothetical protein V4655_08745 [Bdellovibrionota bacterium]